MKTCFVFTLLILFILSTMDALATQMVYTPVNPSFGGSPLNGNWLLGMAQAQNTHVEKSSYSYSNDIVDNFEESLTRQVLYNISRKIVEDTFGSSDSDLGEGHYEFGDYVIDVQSTEGESVKVFINDITTGNSTTVEVPYYY